MESTREFASWTQRYLAATTESERADLLVEGTRLAGRRRNEIYDLMASDPAAALASAVPVSVRMKLPGSIQAMLEERVAGRGFFRVLIADDFESQRPEVRREVVVNDQHYDAFVYGARAAQTSREGIALWGIALTDPSGSSQRKRLAVHQDAVRRLEPGEASMIAVSERICGVSGRPAGWRGTEALAEVAGRVESFCGVDHIELLNWRISSEQGGEASFKAADSWTQGPKNCLFMRVAFPDDPAEPISEDAAYVLMDGVNQWFVENSYGTTSIIPTVTPLLMLSQPKAWYGVQGTGTLLNDARKAARAAGFDTDNYHWDIVRHANVPGFGWSGLGYVRGKGTWLQSSSLGVACHELGHNYGVWHANYWSATGDSVIGPGSNSEYGNSFDTMGAASAGNNQFNAAFKNQLDWLPDGFVQSIAQSGAYRVHAFDVAGLVQGRKYALKVRKDYDRNYWAEFRQKFTNNRWLRNGVVLNWDPWNNGSVNSAGGTHLLDTTPGTPSGKDDASVIIGRTFSDWSAGVHFTPVARNEGGSDNWIDVVVNLGTFPTNSAPVGLIAADRMNAPTGAVVNFHATASDPDGDALAYWWDFGDETFGPNSPVAGKSWSTSGVYVVRCTMSDMKGGTFGQALAITVGSPATFLASGRVISSEGVPLEGVRVHNGQSGGAYRGTYSDSAGHYVLPNLDSGQAMIFAVKYGHTLTRAGWTNPVTLGPDNAGSLDWTATADPVVSVSVVDSASSESGLNPGQFRISRIGPTNTALAVRLNRTGTAFSGGDYTMTPAPAGTPLQVTIPAGALFTNIVVTPLADMISEGPETVTLTLMEHTAYVLGPLAEATLTIADDEPLSKPVVSISSSSSSADNLATESGRDIGAFTFSRNGASLAGDLIILYSVTGSAQQGVDYAALPGVVVIPAGETTTRLELSAIDDLEVETNETVTVTILTDAAYSVSGTTASLTIVDDDPTTVTITATDSFARESGGNASGFTVTRQGSLAANLVVNYGLGGTASSGVDYTTPSGSVTIPAGKTSAGFTINPVNDTVREGDETAIVSLLASPVYNVGNPGQAVIVIVDDELPTITLAASDSSASEPGANTGAFTFTRTGSTAEVLIVKFTISGTAKNGADYSTIADSIVMAAGATNALLVIAPVDDSVLESAEKVTLTLSPASSYNVGTTAPQTVTIGDDDPGPPVVGFTFAASSVLEGDSFVQLSVSLSSNAASTVTVGYSVTGGTATGGGTDYSLAAGTLRFLPGTNQQSLSFSINSDSLVESNETIFITLLNPTNVVLDVNATHVCTILDDDRSGAITVSAVNPLAYESGGEAGRFRISRSGGAAVDQEVRFQIVGTASSPSDYLPVAQTLIIPAGSSFAEILVTPVNDITPETNETVSISLLSAPGGRIGSPDFATVTIVDNDAPDSLPLVTIEATDPGASEPGTDTATFTIRRTGDVGSALTVSYTVGGTATSGTDFTSIGNSTIIPAGAAEKTITLSPRDDSAYDPGETVVVTLTMLDTYRVGLVASATVVIADNETGVYVQAVGSAAEGGTNTAGFLVSRSGDVVSNLVVNFSIAGTAGAGDFTLTGSSVTIQAASNSVFVPLVIMNDTLPEGDETVVLTLSAGLDYAVASPGSATLIILDDEPALSVAASAPTAYEGGGNGTFTFTRSGRTNTALTTRFTLSGSATSGLDFNAIAGTAVIPAGRKSVTVSVTPINDSLLESNETVQLTLVNDPNYSLFLPVTATVTILDDELNSRPVVSIISPAAETVRLLNTDNVLVLAATATDDARPNPPAALTTRWEQLSGPGTAVFAEENSTNTIVRFPANGTYTLRFTADDGQLQAGDELTVNVGIGLTGSLAPLVDAGLAQTIPIFGFAPLHGIFLDGSLPAPLGSVTSLWVKASGPGTVTFTNRTALLASATFPEGGVYVLRLIAGNGEVTVADDITITVIAPNVVSLQVTDSSAAEFGGFSSQGSFGTTGVFTISRTGDLSSDLAVQLNFDGTATNGADYLTLENVVTIPAGIVSVEMTLSPVRDGKPEGSEFAQISLAPGPGYQLGANTGGVINIQDAPWDSWRMEVFSAAENENPSINGETADPDQDGVANLLEYAFDTHPWLANAGSGFTGAMENVTGVGGAQRAFVVRFNQRLVPADLVYEVQVSPDFTNWLSGPGVSQELFPRQENPDRTTFTARVQILGGTSQPEPKIVRLKVRLQELLDRPGTTGGD